jgi:hypothetical protein
MSDTSLIHACEDFTQAYHRLVEAAGAENEAAYDLAAMSVDRLANVIGLMAPTTMNGIRAKARAAVLVWAGPLSDFSDDEDDTTALARSLLTDLAGMPVGASVVWFDSARRTVSIGSRKDWR